MPLRGVLLLAALVGSLLLVAAAPGPRLTGAGAAGRPAIPAHGPAESSASQPSTAAAAPALKADDGEGLGQDELERQVAYSRNPYGGSLLQL